MQCFCLTIAKGSTQKAAVLGEFSTMSKGMSYGNPFHGDERLSIVIENDANTIPERDEERLESLMKVGIQSKHGNKEICMPIMYKVSPMFRNKKAYKKCFDPLVVSIGPYHHGKPELDLIEKHKLSMTSQYVNACKQTPRVLYKQVLKVAEDARKCYLEGSTNMFDDGAFAWMMFLDGCFILQFISNPEDLEMGFRNKAFVGRDLLLIENQLPFQVLEVLMSFRFKQEEWKKLFIDFFRSHPHSEKEKIVVEDKPVHLLDFVRSILIDKREVTRSSYSNDDWYSFRSAKELNSVGINFRPSKSHRFTDVSFQPFFLQAFLRLPPIVIDDFTKSKLLNLVAYEAFPNMPNNLGVSSYVCLMDSLIDCAEDVKELRKRGIICNLLGNDEQVADLFSMIGDELVSNPYTYADVKEKIQTNYKNKSKIWVAEWLHTHFDSPWTLLASSAAVLAIVLTTIQTTWTVFELNKFNVTKIVNH